LDGVEGADGGGEGVGAVSVEDGLGAGAEGGVGGTGVVEAFGEASDVESGAADDDGEGRGGRGEDGQEGGADGGEPVGDGKGAVGSDEVEAVGGG
jgi:hypothetical protein